MYEDREAKTILGYKMNWALDWIPYDMVSKGSPQKRKEGVQLSSSDLVFLSR